MVTPIKRINTFATHRDYGPAGYARVLPARTARHWNLAYPRGELTAPF
jgi:hypothetical protein